MSKLTEMESRPLGDSGVQASVVGLGCNNFGRRVDLEGTRAVVDAALAQGVTFFDTADVYGDRGGSETLLGEVLAGRRDEVVLTTKFGSPMSDDAIAARGSAAYIAGAVEASLRRLRTDVIDLYWYHRSDGVTPIAETLGALHELVTAGKVRALGCSNFDGAMLREADEVARANDLTRFTAVQNEYSLLRRQPAEDDALPVCRELDIAFVPYFPLASGLLTGKYRADQAAPEGTRLAGRDEIATDGEFALVAALEGYAAERGIALVDVAIGALLAQEGVASVIAGATRPEQVVANAGAARWRPAAQDIADLEDILATHPV